MKTVFILALFLTACGAPFEASETWDCGDSCIAECSFVSEHEKQACVDSCDSCDGKPQPAFLHGLKEDRPPGWLTDPDHPGSEAWK